MKKIGVLTSGGDTPGMNSAIRAVFKEADARGMDVMGIFHGYKGLIEGRIRQLTHEDVAVGRPFGRPIIKVCIVHAQFAATAPALAIMSAASALVA